MFSFSSYAGGITASSYGISFQSIGALTASLAIFLPGTLLIYFVYPIWEYFRNIDVVKVALHGTSAVAVGLIATSAIILLQQTSFSIINILILLFTFLLLL
ncbi:chromate transporter [Culicoidibacter larvae]|uniref:chromate transporter n=1 Tax=Culicoidibacter larvae TaxID=2579976 RepID=UPI0018F058ED|nr:chromate transporter [Culicoidibacter larvae]